MDDTNTVRMVLNNYENLYLAFMYEIKAVWFCSSENEWDESDVREAVANVTELAKAIDGNVDGFSDMLSVDWDLVDMETIVRDELNEIPKDERKTY